MLSDGRNARPTTALAIWACRARRRNNGFDPEAFTDFSDILGDFFGFKDMFGGGGGGQRRSRAQRGEDLRYDLEIDFEEAVAGVTADIQAPRMEACSRCSATGGAGNPAERMPHLPRTRRSSLSAELPFHPPNMQYVQWRRQDHRNPCTVAAAKATGRRSVNSRSLFRRAWIPARGSAFREGQPGFNGGPTGDLYVFLKVRDHAFFDGRKTICIAPFPINFAQAALGCEIEVPTLERAEQLKIPEGTQSGAQFRFRSKGVPW